MENADGKARSRVKPECQFFDILSKNPILFVTLYITCHLYTRYISITHFLTHYGTLYALNIISVNFQMDHPTLRGS